ncbi:MAG: oligosaccharide flippase family protein [candidate division Zixibacteria bacterium]|nr:oligosaccharide flippase family protein [candidate division Zixibacteria bacterium]
MEKALEASTPSGAGPAAPASQSFSGKVIRNTLFNVFGMVWGMGIRFFITPYTWHHIGNDLAGVWSVVGILTGYFGLLDFGLARSFDKYFAEYYTKRDWACFNRVFNIGLIFYVFFALSIVALVVVGYPYLMPLLGLSADRIGQENFDTAVFAVIGSIVIFGWGMATSVYGMIMIGLQRMDTLNKINIGASTLGVVGTVIALEGGYGLRGLVVSSGVVAVISTVVTVVAASALMPGLRLNPFLAEWTMFRQMFGFGTKLQVAKLANLLTYQLNSLLVSRFLHVGLVTPYSFAAGFIGSIRNVVLMLPSAVIPATAELEARNEKERSLEFYERGTRYLVLIGTPICMFSIIAAPLIMLAWLGPEYHLAPEATRLIQLLTIGYYANLSTGVATGVAVGMGKPEYEMKFGIALAVFTVALSAGLVHTMGFYGPGIGSTVSLTVCALYFYRLFHTYLGQPLLPFLHRMYTVPIGASLAAGFLVFITQQGAVALLDPTHRPAALFLFGTEALIFFALYTIFVLKTSYLDCYDRALFRRYVGKLRFLQPVSEK